MLLILVTLEVTKLERSREAKEEQPKNILSIRETFEVSKLERSIVFKSEQSENMPIIFVTFEVSKQERSSSVKAEQCKKIQLISVTCEVLRYSNPSMLLSDWRYSNHLAMVVGRKSRNEASNTTVVTVVARDSLVPAQAGIRIFQSFFLSSIPHVVPLRLARKVS